MMFNFNQKRIENWVALLNCITEQISLTPGASGFKINEAKIPDNLKRVYSLYKGKAGYWAQLIYLMNIRDDKCLAPLGAALIKEGFSYPVVSSVAGTLKPHYVDNPIPIIPYDADYIRKEIVYLNNPADMQNKRLLGYALLKYSGPEALKIAQEVIVEEPGSMESLMLMGRVCESMGDLNAAETHYEKAWNTHKNDYDCFTCYLRVLNKNGKSGLVEGKINASGFPVIGGIKHESLRAQNKLARNKNDLLNEYLRLNKKLPDEASIDIAELYLETGDYKQAIRWAEKCPIDIPEAAKVKAKVLYSQGKWVKAIPCYELYLNYTAGDNGSKMELANCYLMVKDYENAILNAKAIPGNHNRFILGKAYVLSAKWDEALDLQVRNPDTFSRQPEYLMHLFLSLGELAPAAKLISNWIEKNPNDGKAWMYMGQLSIMNNQPNDAIRYYQNALTYLRRNDVCRQRVRAHLEYLQDSEN